MRIRKHIVRSIVLGLAATTLAYAYPAESNVSSFTNLSEMRQEKVAFARYRIAQVATELESVQSHLVTAAEEMLYEKMAFKAFLIANQDVVLAD